MIEDKEISYTSITDDVIWISPTLLTSNKFTPLERIVLAKINVTHHPIKIDEFANSLGVSEKSITNSINKFKNLKLVSEINKGKNGPKLNINKKKLEKYLES